jgi:hypothetical protein
MNLPVWLTVFISGLVGSWAARLVAGLFVIPLLYGAHNAARDPTNVWIVLSLGSAAGQALLTALLLTALLPSLSGRHVGFGTALVATICGYLVSTILTILLFHATIESNVMAAGGSGMMPAFGLAALLLPIAGIAVTTWMLTSSSTGGSGGDTSHLYPASFYDEIRKDR